MDILDDATATAELLLKAELAAHAAAAARAGPQATGECLSCGAFLGDAVRRWCGPECRDDYERDQRAQRRNLKVGA